MIHLVLKHLALLSFYKLMQLALPRTGVVKNGSLRSPLISFAAVIVPRYRCARCFSTWHYFFLFTYAISSAPFGGREKKIQSFIHSDTVFRSRTASSSMTTFSFSTSPSWHGSPIPTPTMRHTRRRAALPPLKDLACHSPGVRSSQLHDATGPVCFTALSSCS